MTDKYRWTWVIGGPFPPVRGKFHVFPAFCSFFFLLSAWLSATNTKYYYSTAGATWGPPWEEQTDKRLTRKIRYPTRANST